ncbi:MAG: hypothetical protein KIT00_08860, partial [Rhodospirillales bacterium]|nr:hypothetical protein [Rhodospirillales bacterium]
LTAARRSVRLLATNGVGVGFGHAESVATRAMAAVYALGHRLSASAWNKAFVRHAEADAIPSTENGDADAQSNWYEAVTLMDEGRFRAAVDLFDIENKALKDDEAAAILRSKLVFYFHALTELGRRDTAESILPHAKHSLAAASQGLGFSDDEFRVSLVVSHAKMLFYLEEDAAALDALDELDALDPVLLAANNTATFARIYRGLLGHEDDDIDLPATVEANLTRLFQALSAGPDRVAAQSAGVAWHGSGLFCAGSPHAWLDRKLVSLFEPAILHSIRRGRRDDACAILKQWVRLAEGRALDDAVPENTPTRNHAAALIAAFRAELGPPKERDGRVAEAWTHRQVDLEANGSERAFVYRRAFTLCGIG